MISDEQVQAALKAYKSTRGPASDSMRNALEAAEIEDVERWLTTVPPQQEKLEAADWRAFRDVQLRCHELDPRVVPDLELSQGDYWPARNKDELARFKEWLASQDEPDFLDELEAELAARRPVPVQQDELQITPNDSKDLELGPVQQDEPEDYPGSFVRGDFALCWNTGNLEVHDGKSHTALCEADAQALSRWLIAVLPVQQDEPAGEPVPKWIVDNAAAKGWDLSPEDAPLPRPRPPRSHRDDESLRRWEARHPSVRFRPTVPLEQECDHVWRSSFGDTFCEKCNQDAPVEIASERCRTCKGSGTWADEGWSKPPQPCKACSGSGLAPIRKRKPTVPVQQDEPEGVCAFPNCSCTENRCPAKGERGPFCDHGFHPRLCGRCAPVPEAVTDEDEVQCQMCKTVQPRPDKECGHCGAGPKYLCPIHTRPAAAPVQQEPEERCDHDWIVETRTASIKVCQSCGMEQAKNMDDAVVGLCAAVPSVGLRDRVACELANLEYERSGRPCETEDFYANADRVLSVLHEAGTQEDGLDALARQFKNGQTVVWGDGPHQQGTVVGFCYTIPEQAGGPDRPALVVKDHWSDRTGHVLPSELIAAPAVSGTPDGDA